jgi:hypothetical protein
MGGATENLVMIGGTPILGGLAIALYGLSAVALIRSLSKKAAIPEGVAIPTSSF